MASPPTGTVTFLFTDIEGSTKLWEHDAQAMQAALARHDELLRRTIEEHGGYVFKTVGDAFCCAFLTAPDALEAALEIQRRLLSSEWEHIGPLRVRMALHTGAAEERHGDYFGPPVNRVARLLSAAHGGQVLLSLPAQELVRDQLPAEAALMDLGERRLKDLFRPERVFQVVASSLPSEFPPLRTLESRSNNLPLQPTPLVGREREVGEVANRLRSKEVRLLTLTGPGGTGKTRLALQAGADLLEEFDEGVFFVALATITDPGLVPSTIAEPLGVRESAEQPLTESLQSYLGDKHLLLILDNFEQVLEWAPVVGELVAACPKLKVLATSRIPLRLYGEQEYPVLPLAFPDPRVLPPLGVLTQYEAVRLFVERARAVKADFEVTNENAPAVAEVCARLDGLPLAIELAAARVRMLPPQALLKRLSNRLKLLKGGPRDLPTRHQTLRSTIDWSYELLEDEEKALFERLSAFSGGRTLEAIEEICDPEKDLDILEGVESLLEKSLLRQEEGVGGEPRFVMLETVHEYAREKLEASGVAKELRRRHAEYFLRLAEETDPKLRGPQQLKWLERLEAEHDNMRAALSWSLEEGGDVELGLRVAGALGWFWYVRGHYVEGRKWLEEALAKEGWAPAAVQARALAAAGWLAYQQADLGRMEEASLEGMNLFRQAKGARSKDTEQFLHLVLGAAKWERGDLKQAFELLEAGLALSREEGEEYWIAEFIHDLGLAWILQGDTERGMELLDEALRLSRALGDRLLISYCLLNLGDEVLDKGDHQRAAELLEEGVALCRELGAVGEVAWGLDALGTIALLHNDLETAQALYQEGLTLSRELGRKTSLGGCIEGLAAVYGSRGADIRAARLWGATEALYQNIGGRLQDFTPWRAVEARLAAVRSRLGDAVWEETLDKGRAMGLEEAVSYALEGEEAGG